MNRAQRQKKQERRRKIDADEDKLRWLNDLLTSHGTDRGDWESNRDEGPAQGILQKIIVSPNLVIIDLH